MAVIPDDSPLILVCDDDSMQRLLIRQCLESEGMRILEAYARIRSELSSGA